MEVTGILKVKSDAKDVSAKFKTRDFVLTENSSQYPQHISFQLAQDKCTLIDTLNIGDEVKVTFNLRGREWTSPQGEVKYFNTLDAWKVEKLGTPAAGAPAKTNVAAAKKDTKAPDAPTFVASSGDDDLPF